MTTLLTALTCLAAVLLLVVVAVNLVRIIRELEAIGGTPTSFLAKIRFGLRAIETQTSHLGPKLDRLNDGLSSLDRGLRAVESNLAATLAALKGGSK